MHVHQTKGIVLRAVKYGETSLIVSIYTAVFGVQQYIVKGIRSTSKKSSANASCFQEGAILDLQVQHQQIKNFQYIKEFQWAYLYHNIFNNVIKNSVLLYIIEILQHSNKQPEGNNEIYDFTEEVLMKLDLADTAFTANLPLYYSIKLAAKLGLEIQGHYSSETPILDYQEGIFIASTPAHRNYMQEELSKSLSILILSPLEEIGNVVLNRSARNEMIEHIQFFFQFHVPYFGKLKSPEILKQILG